MTCGYEWEDWNTDDPAVECEGCHVCILAMNHTDAEHECACGEAQEEVLHVSS